MLKVPCHSNSECPWADVVELIPLSHRSFISGSFATWMAERALVSSTPLWTPNDIDVFVCLPLIEFNTLVQSFVTSISRAPVAMGDFRVILRRTDMINVVLHNCSVSFIKCCAGSTAFDVVSDFDIDICTPIVVREGGALCVHMTPSVAESITDLKMHCHVRKRQPRFMQYPLQRSLNRIRKYVSRGYSFASLTFHSTTHIDFPDRDAESSLFVDDFLHVPSPSMNCSCVVIETMDD